MSEPRTLTDDEQAFLAWLREQPEFKQRLESALRELVIEFAQKWHR